jgi:hypothetical protein
LTINDIGYKLIIKMGWERQWGCMAGRRPLAGLVANNDKFGFVLFGYSLANYLFSGTMKIIV